MDILLYLTQLLKTRKTVGIAGLGTLFKKKSPGKYDAEKHEFLPPSYNLAFTTEIKEQEELANFINQERNITVDSANYYINEFVERIQTELEENKEADLATLGKLSLVNDEIIFTPTQDDAVGFEFYGLPTVTEIQNNEDVQENLSSNADENLLEEIVEENKLEEENPGVETTDEIEENVLLNDEQEVYEEITEVANDKTYHQLNDTPTAVETAEVESIPEPTEEVIVEEEVYIEEEEKKAGMPFFMKFLIAFLIIVALGAIVYFINPNFFNNYFNKNFGNKQEQVLPPVLNDSLTNPVDTTKADTLTQNNDLVKLGVDTIAKSTIDSSKVNVYDVLVSAVSSEKKANRIIANLASEGIKAKKIRLSKTMINISAGTFFDETAAVKHQDSLRIKLKDRGIYIHVTKPKK